MQNLLAKQRNATKQQKEQQRARILPQTGADPRGKGGGPSDYAPGGADIRLRGHKGSPPHTSTRERGSCLWALCV